MHNNPTEKSSIVDQFQGGIGAVSKLFATSFNSKNDLIDFQITSFAIVRSKCFKEEYCTPQRLFRTVVDIIFEHMNSRGLVKSNQSTKVYLQIARRIVSSFCIDGWLYYKKSEELSGVFLETKYPIYPGFYFLNDSINFSGIENLVRPPGHGLAIGFIGDSANCLHYQGAMAMASNIFQINIERAKECEIQLRNGNFFVKSSKTWRKVESENDLMRYNQQKNQLSRFREIYKVAKDGFSWDVKTDFRGRLYYIAGEISPQAGGIALYIVTNDKMVTLDSTASFAQFMSILTGDIKIAKACGLLNFTEAPSDFYSEILFQCSGIRFDRDSPQRKLAKHYLMPKAYGSSDEKSIEIMLEIASNEGIDASCAMEIAQQLKKYKVINEIKVHAAKAAIKLGKNGKQLSWKTPSGFCVSQNYWKKESIPWFSKGDIKFMPQQISFMEKTNEVCLSISGSATTDKCADIAASANIIQSLDAAFMALTLMEYKKETGKTFIAIHDSATLDCQEAVSDFKRIAWRVFVRIAENLSEVRSLLELPEPDLSWLDCEKVPTFLSEE